MGRPPLTLALASVLAAQVEGAARPSLLARLQPADPVEPPAAEPVPARGPGAEDVPFLAPVIPFPRVIPMPRRPQPEFDPDPSAA